MTDTITQFKNNLRFCLMAGKQFKKHCQLAYNNAVQYGLATDNHCLLSEWLNALNDNKLLSTDLLMKIIRTTNVNFRYDSKKKTISQGKDFKKEETLLIEDIFALGKSPIQKDFNLDNVNRILKSLIKKSFDNGIDSIKLRAVFNQQLSSYSKE